MQVRASLTGWGSLSSNLSMDYVLPTVPIGYTLSPLQAVSKNALVSIRLPGINQPMGIEVTQWVIDHAWRTKPYLSTNKKSDKTALTLSPPTKNAKRNTEPACKRRWLRIISPRARERKRWWHYLANMSLSHEVNALLSGTRQRPYFHSLKMP